MFEWIVPIAVAVFWIIGHLLREKEQEAPVKRPRADDRSATSDIDRFLQEIERLRKESRGPTGDAENSPSKVVVVKKRPQPKPVPVPRSRLVVQSVQPAEVIPVVAEAATVSIGQKPAPVAPTVTHRPDSRLLREAVDHLKSRRVLASAFIMREILDRPRSIRRWR